MFERDEGKRFHFPLKTKEIYEKRKTYEHNLVEEDRTNKQ